MSRKRRCPTQQDTLSGRLSDVRFSSNTQGLRFNYVQPRGVYQSEFYNAAQVGLKPSLTLFISNREDYNGQKYLEFEGKDYEVIRTDWNAQRDGLSLICEERVRNGSNESVNDGK